MKNRPLAVVIVALVLIIVGSAGFAYHVKDFFNHEEKIQEVILVQLLRAIAILSGILLLRGNSVGRWLAIAWVLVHVIISGFNSIPEMIAHIAIFIIVTTLLFLPKSSLYFQRHRKLQS